MSFCMCSCLSWTISVKQKGKLSKRLCSVGIAMKSAGRLSSLWYRSDFSMAASEDSAQGCFFFFFQPINVIIQAQLSRGKSNVHFPPLCLRVMWWVCLVKNSTSWYYLVNTVDLGIFSVQNHHIRKAWWEIQCNGDMVWPVGCPMKHIQFLQCWHLSKCHRQTGAKASSQTRPETITQDYTMQRLENSVQQAQAI